MFSIFKYFCIYMIVMIDILAADQQLACEVEYDLRKFVRQGTETVRQEESDSDTSASGVVL